MPALGGFGASILPLFRNPVSYCIYALAAMFVALSFGEPPLLVVQHLLAPYTVDITRGVGRELAAVFRGLVLVLQVVLLLVVYAVTRCRTRARRVAFSILGAIVALAYFCVVALAYVAPRLH